MALTPKSRLWSSRPAAHATAAPTASPSAASRIPWPSTRRNTSPRVAPSAIRTPSSGVRSAASAATTLPAPTAASATASPANTTSSRARNRGPATESESTVSMLRKPSTGSAGSSAWVASRTAGARASGESGERVTRFTVRGAKPTPAAVWG